MMKNALNLFFILIAILLSFCGNRYHTNQNIPLSNWKFKKGDNIIYAAMRCDDSKWEKISTDKSWEFQSYPEYDGYAWYRCHIFIPSSLKYESVMKDSLCFSLGVIDDFDQVYLNGMILGENNRTLLAGAASADSAFNTGLSRYNIDRMYIIPSNDKRIQWDKENVISVRVFDKTLFGGISTAATPYIGMKKLISFQKEKFYSVDGSGKVNTSLILKNLYDINLNAVVSVKAENVKTKEQIYDNQFSVKLSGGENKTIEVLLPVCTDSIRVSLAFQDDNLKTQIIDEVIVPYSLRMPLVH